MTELLVLENWGAYDERKRERGKDPRYFCCQCQWEIDFLVSRIREVIDQVMEKQVRTAINKAAQYSQPLCKRYDFVMQVLRHLMFQ